MQSMCPNDYVLHECGARINLKTQSCVDTMLVSTSGLAEVTTEAGYSSKKFIAWWRRSSVDKASINQIVSNICKFVPDKCCHVGGTCFYAESELATDDKFVKLRSQRTQLNMKDYKLLELD